MLLILAGLIGLWFGTRWVVKGALALADLYNLSHAFVGFAILAVGTDLPEIFVTIKASLLQLNGVESSGIISGNALGSSIGNMAVVLGISAFFVRFKMEKGVLLRNGFFLLASVLLLFIFGFNGQMSRLEGAILIIAYLVYYFTSIKNNLKASNENTVKLKHKPFAIIVYLLAGFAILIFSSNLVVNNAVLLAGKWGVAQSFIGVAIVGLGTSLPELAVSVGAAFRKSYDLSVSNIIGSNIFNTLILSGLGGVISEFSFENRLLFFDFPVLFLITAIVIIFLWRKGIGKAEGLALMLLYCIYIFLKAIYFAEV